MKQTLQPDHDCRDYIIYHVAGEYYCEHESHDSDTNDGVYFFTDFGFKAEDLANEFYPDWNKPQALQYDFDKEMKEFFDECVKRNDHYHPLEVKN